MSINVWRLAGDTLNITCNLLYCNYQVHRDFLITLYIAICLTHIDILYAASVTIMRLGIRSHATSAPLALLLRSAVTSSKTFLPWLGNHSQFSMFYVIFVFSSPKLSKIRYFHFRNFFACCTVLFILFTCTKEQTKTNVSSWELPSTDSVRCLYNVKCKISWIWATRCLLYVQAEKIPLFLVEIKHCSRFPIVSCRFARLQEYLCLDRWWCRYELQHRKRLKMANVLLCWCYSSSYSD